MVLLWGDNGTPPAGTSIPIINVSVERVDTSKPWEHPDSLDPQIEVFAPDGFLPQNLVAWDNQPGVDLIASLHDAVLPLTDLRQFDL